MPKLVRFKGWEKMGSWRGRGANSSNAGTLKVSRAWAFASLGACTPRCESSRPLAAINRYSANRALYCAVS